MKNIAILGASGTIGKLTIEVISKKNINVNLVAISVGNNYQYAIDLAQKFPIELIGIKNKEDLDFVQSKVNCKVVAGKDAQVLVATYHKVDTVVNAVVGSIGLKPTYEAIKLSKNIALANKETLVCAGHIIMPLAKKTGSIIMPIDSEHSAIFQCLNGQNMSEVSKIILTASGGPFRQLDLSEFSKITLAEALKHPNWSMGEKITIDSSTMFNKALEIIEAYWLFNVKPNQIDVIIHPQSIVHSAVEFQDQAVIAQLGMPSMILPIQYALTYPNRLEPPTNINLDLTKISNLTFEKVDLQKFPAIKLAFDILKSKPDQSVVMNAANEAAVSLFINSKIKYVDIYEVVYSACNNFLQLDTTTIDNIIKIDNEVKDWVFTKYGGSNGNR